MLPGEGMYVLTGPTDNVDAYGNTCPGSAFGATVAIEAGE